MGMNQLILQEPIRELDSLQVGEKVFVVIAKNLSISTVVLISKNSIRTDCGNQFSIKTGNSYRKTGTGPNYLVIPTSDDLFHIERSKKTFDFGCADFLF